MHVGGSLPSQHVVPCLHFMPIVAIVLPCPQTPPNAPAQHKHVQSSSQHTDTSCSHELGLFSAPAGANTHKVLQFSTWQPCTPARFSNRSESLLIQDHAHPPTHSLHSPHNQPLCKRVRLLYEICTLLRHEGIESRKISVSTLSLGSHGRRPLGRRAVAPGQTPNTTTITSMTIQLNSRGGPV